jgi:thiol-disulfide isomerase/thioredoxin
MKRKLLVLCLFAGCALGGGALALSAAELGDPAPALKISEWVKGGPVDLAAGKDKTTYVVEFWATWCPPCRTSIPHLTEIQKKFKDRGVVVIGITDEKLATVKKFVTPMGDKMDYVVAIDDGKKTSDGYMEAFKQNGIPHAFIVDKTGRIVWHGHPMAQLDDTLEQVVSGKYDMSVAKKRDRAQQLSEEYYELAVSDENSSRLEELGKELTKLDEEIGGINPGQKFDADKIRKQARFQGAMRNYQMALAQEKPDAEIATLEAKVKQNAPDEFDFPEFKKNFKFQRAYMNYYRAATSDSDQDKLEPLAKELQATQTKNAMMLNDVAWSLLTDEKIKNRDLNLAAALAKAAYDACDGKESSIVDTYARALADTGKLSEAVRYQKAAVELCKDDEQKNTLKKTLEEYEKKASAK